MHDLGANVVRTYTIHPPTFYQALQAHNARHRDAPLWVVHGVWTDLLPRTTTTKIRSGKARSSPRCAAWWIYYTAGRTSRDDRGTPAVLTPPTSPSGCTPTSSDANGSLSPSIAFNAMRPDLTSWNGRFLTLEHGSPMDAWLAKATEEIVAYETDTYRAQRPVAYTNWPTLDPMRHPTETTVKEEVAIRERLGEKVGSVPLEYDNDGAGLSAASVRTTASFPAGYFASFHAYPLLPRLHGARPRVRDGPLPVRPVELLRVSR